MIARSTVLLTACLMGPIAPSHAQLSITLPSIGEVANAVTAPITAPTETTIRILKGDDPSRAVTGPWAGSGSVVQRSSRTFQKAQDVFTQVSGQTIERSLGPEWRRGYEALTTSQRVQFELATTSGRFLGGCMKGDPCTINQLVAGPLAAALRDAYKVYWQSSTPIPPALVRTLAFTVPPRVLGAARWIVGNTPTFAGPGFLNTGHEALGNGNAVTVGNIMIFSRMPDLTKRSDWIWLLHELRHIEQYMGFSDNALESIDGFSVAYVQHYRAMEGDAQRLGMSDYEQLAKRYAIR